MLSLYIMMVAKDMFWLSAGNFLFSALNNLPTTVYAAVIPELIRLTERAATLTWPPSCWTGRRLPPR